MARNICEARGNSLHANKSWFAAMKGIFDTVSHFATELRTSNHYLPDMVKCKFVNYSDYLIPTHPIFMIRDS